MQQRFGLIALGFRFLNRPAGILEFVLAAPFVIDVTNGTEQLAFMVGGHVPVGPEFTPVFLEKPGLETRDGLPPHELFKSPLDRRAVRLMNEMADGFPGH